MRTTGPSTNGSWTTCRCRAGRGRYEFARLNLTYTVMSKRKLLQLVQNGDVTGWDDPRMPTLMGFRRRGYTPEAIRAFCELIGVGRSDSWIDMSILEEFVRDDLNERAPRAMAVLKPLKLVIDNYPEGIDWKSSRPPIIPSSRKWGPSKCPSPVSCTSNRTTSWKCRPKGFHRLAPGQEVRLRYAYIVRCTGVVKDER